MQESIKIEKLTGFTGEEIEQAFKIARQKQLPVLVDFWAPDCKGCKKMDVTTYRNSEIISYINRHFIFVKYDITNKANQKIQNSPVLWTPTFIVFSGDGSEVRKISGYLKNDRFHGEMEIGRALALVRKAKNNAALELLEDFIATTTNETLRSEAMYWAGVASYFLNKRNPGSLVPFWEKLMKDYPAGDWASKADCLDVTIDKFHQSGRSTQHLDSEEI